MYSIVVFVSHNALILTNMDHGLLIALRQIISMGREKIAKMLLLPMIQSHVIYNRTLNIWLDVNYCVPDSEDIPDEVKNNSGIIFKAIGADEIGHYVGDIAVSRKAIAICAFISLLVA